MDSVLLEYKKLDMKKHYPCCGPGILRSEQFTAKFLLDMYKFIFEGSYGCTKRVDNCMFNREYCNVLKQGRPKAKKKEKEEVVKTTDAVETTQSIRDPSLDEIRRRYPHR